MKDDIVTQLRAFGANSFMLKAADEIERLRAERDELQREVDRLYDDKFSPDGGLWSRE
jgi:cell division protein FtsB